MTCEELQAAVDAAYAAWLNDPTPENLAAMQAAQGAWTQAGCNVGVGGGGNGSGPPGFEG